MGKIKTCVNCGLANQEEEVICAGCGCMLPSVRIEAANNVAPNLSMYKQSRQEEPKSTITPPPEPPAPPVAVHAPDADTVVIGRLAIDKNAAPLRVIVTDMDIDFWTMTMLLVKLAFAIIPAAFIVTILVVFLFALFKSLN
jgi:hypothetical protein